MDQARSSEPGQVPAVNGGNGNRAPKDEKGINRVEEEKLRSLGLFARKVAHDFNNILGGILGYASFMKTIVKEDDSIYRYVDIIESSAIRGSKLTKKLLDFGRGEEPEPKTIEINGVVEEAFSQAVGDLGDKINVEKSLDEGLPKINADRDQLIRVFSSIIENAVEAMADGGDIRVQSGMAGDSEICVTISDTGEGIEALNLDAVFDPLFTTREKGRGFGLSIACRMIKNHGGRIDLESEPGKGTILKVFLPVK